MKNAIIIDGTTYELVHHNGDIDVCVSCDLHDICFPLGYALCVSIHNAENNDHYIEQPKQKGGQS